MNRRENRKIFLILLCWGIITVSAFWQMVGKYLRPVTRPDGAITLHPEQHPPVPVSRLHSDQGELLLSPGQPITLLNFWSPDCPCSRYMESHVSKLIDQYASKGVRFITIVHSGKSPNLQQQAQIAWQNRRLPTAAVVDAGDELARRFGVWAAPAAVIVDRSGYIVYLGSYNIARYCEDGKTAYAQQALESLLSGKPILHQGTPFYGCQVTADRSSSGTTIRQTIL